MTIKENFKVERLDRDVSRVWNRQDVSEKDIGKLEEEVTFLQGVLRHVVNHLLGDTCYEEFVEEIEAELGGEDGVDAYLDPDPDDPNELGWDDEAASEQA